MLGNLSRKQIWAGILVIVIALIVELFILEGTIGISFPSDRYSGLSTLEIRLIGTEEHYITKNVRFTVVDLLTNHGSNLETLVLREYFVTNRNPNAEGPPNATVTVEAMYGDKVKWTFRESGERGDAITDTLYRVIKYGNGETANLYIYFSLADGRKVRTNRSVELSKDELEALDGSVIP
jgi:hypothetical protein